MKSLAFVEKMTDYLQNDGLGMDNDKISLFMDKLTYISRENQWRLHNKFGHIVHGFASLNRICSRLEIRLLEILLH
jgi:hypothetical protein